MRRHRAMGWAAAAALLAAGVGTALAQPRDVEERDVIRRRVGPEIARIFGPRRQRPG